MFYTKLQQRFRDLQSDDCKDIYKGKQYCENKGPLNSLDNVCSLILVSTMGLLVVSNVSKKVKQSKSGKGIHMFTRFMMLRKDL